MIGTKLGSYTIVEALGEGGMGVVYVGEHTVLGRRAAIKVLHPDLARRPDTVKRFLHEARSATRVKHAGLVDVFDFGTDEAGNAYLIMELLEGESLAARLRRQGIPPLSWALMVSRQIALACDAVHAQGIVHRDLKPDNVFLCPDDAVPGGERVKVLDFGLAKAAHDERGTSIRTRTGTVMGTPLYMSPEQCRGAGTPLDARSDVYSLGCMLFEMLCGRPPFVHEGMGDLLVSHIHDPAPHPSGFGGAVPADVEAVVLRMLEKKPADRPQTMREVVTALEATESGKMTTSGPYTRLAGISQPPRGSVASMERLGAQTTLAGAASQMMDDEVPTGRGRLFAGIAAAAVVGAAVLGWVVLREKPSPQAAVPAPTPTPEAAIAPAEAPSPAPAPPEMVTLKVKSNPSGADAFLFDGRRLCVTPCTIERERGGTLVVALQKTGFDRREVELSLEADREYAFDLQKHGRTTPTVKPREKIKNAVVDPYSN